MLLRKQNIWWPTWPGWLFIILLLTGITLLYAWKAESFLASTEREPADILIVEGWIGAEGVQAAAKEFTQGGYNYVVTTGGRREEFSQKQWDLAELSARELGKCGISPEQIIQASSPLVSTHRTYSFASAARKALDEKGIHPLGINVFTKGAHARRSRLVYGKLTDVPVGVISWYPSKIADLRWWESSERAKDLLSETFGYLFEATLNSGRSREESSEVSGETASAPSQQ